jgi:protein-disulfide isomerase
MRHLLTAALAALLLGSVAPAVRADTAAADAISREDLHGEIRAYLLDNPEIMMEMMAILEERQRSEAAASDEALVAENAAAIFDDGFSHVAGNPDGDVTIVEFLDYQCGYCRRAHPEVLQLLADDGNIRWIIKEFPILGPDSELAARATIAALMIAGGDAYETLHDLMMTHSGPVNDAALDGLLTDAGLDPAAIRAGMEDPEVTRRLVETRALAERLAISGTPTFILGDQLARGYLPLDQMRDVVAGVREES